MAKPINPQAFGAFGPESTSIQEDLQSLNPEKGALAGISPIIPTPAQSAVEQAPLMSENPIETTTVNPVTPEAIQAAQDTVSQLQASGQIPVPKPTLEPTPEQLDRSMFDIGPEEVTKPAEPQPVVMPPEQRAMIDTFSKQMNANAAIAAAQAKSFKDTAKAHQETVQYLQDEQKKNAERLQNFKAETEGYKKSLLTLADDIGNSKPEFKDYWADKTTGFKVLAAISIGLSQRPDGVNTASNIIQKAADQDLDKQRYAYEQGLQNKKLKASMIDNVYGRAMQTFGDETAALNVARGIQLEKTKSKIDQYAAESGSQTVRQQANILNAELTRQQQQAYQQFQGAMAQKAYLNSIGGAGAIAKLSPLEMQQLGLPKEVVDAATKQRELTLAGTDIIMPDRETRAKVEAEIGDTAVAVKGLKDLYNLTNPKNWSKYNVENRAMANQKINELAGNLRQPILGPGIMDAKEYQRLTKDVIGDPTTMLKLESDETSRKKLLALANSLEAKMRVKVAPYIQGGTSFVTRPVITQTPKK